MSDFLEEVETTLREAGWFPGRHISTEKWFTAFGNEGLPRHRAADKFLSEFGGILVDISGPGITSAREPFELDPMLCEGEGGRFAGWSKNLGKTIFPIGVLDDGRFFLGIDENEEVYLLETWVASFGRMPVALHHLILGVQPVTIAEA
ncbi:SUKH-3 domain-containing protein [Streptomyces hydrogenans]|uniref:SUKH-3 domain-containing protein n=1 Tax=Streptomyces hydrogenans TaxID=1873719 RepID=UPI0038015E6C